MGNPRGTSVPDVVAYGQSLLRYPVVWEQNQLNEGKYGDAETLSKAKNTSVSKLMNAGILSAKGGKVRLLRRDELPAHWNPATNQRTPDWQVS